MLDKQLIYNFAFNIFTSLSTLPPNTAVQWNDAHREDEETQRHGLPPSQSINSP